MGKRRGPLSVPLRYSVLLELAVVAMQVCHGCGVSSRAPPAPGTPSPPQMAPPVWYCALCFLLHPPPLA